MLREAGIGLDDVDLVVCGRSITTCREDLLRYLPLDPDRVVEPALPAHHLAHAYSAYATAPFADCDVLVIDEQGQWLPDNTFERCTWFAGEGGPLQLQQRFLGRRDELSLGMFFDVFAALTGLSEAGLPAAGKLMALAAHGQPRADWPVLLQLAPDGDVTVGLGAADAFLEEAKLPVTPGYEGWSPQSLDGLRLKYQPIHWGTPLAADLARKAQDELETAVVHHATSLRRVSGRRHLAYAGGVALNCTANAHLTKAGYTDVFVHPAATDDGTAIGLAAYGRIEVLGHERRPVRRFSPHLGPRYPQARREMALRTYGLAEYVRQAEAADVADLLASGKIVCWFDGRSEWGPRALGARSILADPTAEGTVARLNSEVKFREPFRPFGLSIAERDAHDLLDLEGVPRSLAPYMLCVARVRDDRLRHVQHDDGTVRYQSVSAGQDRYHRLLLAMESRIGIAAVLNTSFNTFGEPLVESPEDAVRQFLLCGADALFMDGVLVELAALPKDVLRQARSIALADTAVEPLRLALQQEAAGFVQAARSTIAQVPRDLALGAPALRDRSGLLMRLALADADQEAALRHADDVLHWSGLPPVAASAATTIAAHGCSPAFPQADAAALLAALAPQGQAAVTLRAVFGTTDASSLREETA